MHVFKFLTASFGVQLFFFCLLSGGGGLPPHAVFGGMANPPKQEGPSRPVDARPSFQVLAAGAMTLPKLAAAEAEQDRYGGWTSLKCAGGVKRYFYAEKIGRRWWLCTPAGNVFWIRAVYNVQVNNTSRDQNGVVYSEVVTRKYGDYQQTWAAQTLRRLKSWGFNAIAEYAVSWVLPTHTDSSWPGGRQPAPLPFMPLVWPAYYSLTNSGNYAPEPVKELIRPTKPSVFSGYRAHSPDIWDPNYTLWLGRALQLDGVIHSWFASPNSDFVIGIQVDDLDSLQGFGPGPDFHTVSNGAVDRGPWRNQPHLAWIILITPPTQTTNREFGQTYKNTKVYSKCALRDFLFQRYQGDISDLNKAWRSNYSTFDSAGGWGTGTGLLDEDGTHPWVPSGQEGWLYLAGATPAMKQDLDDFLFEHAKKYFCDVKAVLNARFPGRMYFGPTTLGGWGTPSRRQVYQAAAACGVDLIGLPTIPLETPDSQARVDFVAQYWGDRPWFSWEGFMANPDSYFYAHGQPDGVHERYATQEARGAGYAAQLNRLLMTHTAEGNYPVVGLKLWEWSDNWGEQANWGLVTRRDNAYDGIEARVAPGKDPWGHPVGGESKDYGDFLSAVRAANASVFARLLASSR